MLVAELLRAKDAQAEPQALENLKDAKNKVSAKSIKRPYCGSRFKAHQRGTWAFVWIGKFKPGYYSKGEVGREGGRQNFTAN